VRTSFEVAELMKYACNAFHAVKIAFANEVGALGRAVGVDGRDVMRVLCEDRKLNLSEAYLRPGFAFGGSCLPKDLRALGAMARSRDLATPLLRAALEANDAHLRRGLSRALALGGPRVALFGVCFKAGTDDLRESPMIRLARELQLAGRTVRIYDEALDPRRLLGANREFMEEELPGLPSLLFDDARALLEGSDVAIFATAPLPGAVLAALRSLAPYRRPVLDLTGAIPAAERAELTPEYEGLCW
jgi:GDP-mannose 6-dehydrogenase